MKSLIIFTIGGIFLLLVSFVLVFFDKSMGQTLMICAVLFIIGGSICDHIDKLK